MMRRVLPMLSVMLAAGACSTAAGQSAATAGSSSERELAEDLKVLATILSENMERAHAPKGAGGGGCPALAPRHPIDVWVYESLRAPALAKPLGEYLPGYGVVVQMEVAAPLPPQSAEPSATRPMSRWEATRRRLGVSGATQLNEQNCLACHESVHGLEKHNIHVPHAEWKPSVTKGLADCAQCHMVQQGPEHGRPLQLTSRRAAVDVLIDTLAESRIRQLDPEESVTLSLTFSASPHMSAEEFYRRYFRKPSKGDPAPKGDAGKAPSKDEPVQVAQGRVRTADLLFNQGRYVEAMNHYQQAANEFEVFMQSHGATDQSRAAYLEVLGRINAALAAGNPADAPVRDRPVRSEPSSFLPARVMVSAKVAEIAAFARGEITREKFRNAVTVRIFDPHVPTSQSQDNRPG